MHGRVKVRTTAEQKEAKRKEREKKLKVYNGVTSKIWKKRAEKELDDEALGLTREVLAANPDFYTMWNFRKEIFLEVSSSRPENDFQALCSSELSFLEDCLQVNPKSYGAWHHRCWIMDHMPHPDWKKELKLCDIYLQHDERNFHCWDYRRFVVARSNVKAKDELEFSTAKISSNFSNFSSWHYRSKLLPLLYPDEESTGRVREDILLQEYELAQNAFFTDPNDQSAWFYHRWLLGRGDSPQNINYLYANKRHNMIVVVFAQPVLIPDKNSVVVTMNGQVRDGEWTTSNGQHIHSLIWVSLLWMLWWFSLPRLVICMDQFVPTPFFFVLKARFYPFNISFISFILMLSIKFHFFSAAGDFESWSKEVNVAARLFSSQLSVEKTGVLTQELESCQQLLELEPDNKWCVFTIIQLMRSLDPLRYEAQTVDYMNILLRTDPYRANYFHDLRSRFCIENEILRAEAAEDRIKVIDLSKKELTTLIHLEHLVPLTEINISSNKLTSLSGCHMLQCAEKILADDNSIASLQGLGPMHSLKELSINNNSIKSIDDLSTLTSCPNLSSLSLTGNPVCQLDDFQNAIKNLFPHIQLLNGVQL
ncbi:geranylgeranyl transferase type-2 subunit alpha-like [Anneissia japonica]|uniref:geranylgeranyl transferase type-2 subunit alpha-like n=1 Tax=Anneissia japonica TaxID=1529436 RepID=UPI001425A4E4|nr:geranylgeranyl transferase type-2 subunit alpha-like [Anneissia japonica]